MMQLQQYTDWEEALGIWNTVSLSPPLFYFFLFFFNGQAVTFCCFGKLKVETEQCRDEKIKE